MNTKTWIRIALANLLIVAALGTLMRYKIGFEFPHFYQKYIQEAHSHFAFTGWITHVLYVLILSLFQNNLIDTRAKLFNTLILFNLLCAYGMLVSFFIQGYGPVSISFSVLSILNGYVFAFFTWKEANRLPAAHPSKNWIKAAIFFGVLSTIGTGVLSYMMATRQYDQTTYLGSIYFYLHFQYNGWFIFTCFALFMDRIKEIVSGSPQARNAFLFFFLAGIPTYFLSTLWADLPVWLYLLVVLAAFFQIIGWWLFVKMIKVNFAKIKLAFPPFIRYILLIVLLALTLKLFLQFVSTIPIVSKLAFGFRPIVIAYLHLILLLIITVFLLAFLYTKGLIRQNRLSRSAIIVFLTGILLNETALAVQGIAAFSYTVIPYINRILFAIAIILLAGAALLFMAQYRTVPTDENQSV